MGFDSLKLVFESGDLSINITLHNSLVVLHGTKYHMSTILLQLWDSPFMGSTHDLYCEAFDKQL